MHVQEKIHALDTLGKELSRTDLTEIMEKARLQNPWFTADNVRIAMESVINMFLNKSALENWLGVYAISESSMKYKVGLVLAGNIPMVGFHDILCVFMADHHSLIKYSEKDNILIPWILEKLVSIAPDAGSYFTAVDKITSYDAVIATGSNNTAKYFSYYFQNVPHIIRKNRNAVAVLTGKESKDELKGLASDIFLYFGLGCRNVSKMYIPEKYNFTSFFQVLDEWKHLADHNKYKNNLDYNHALYLLNKQNFMMHESLLLVESPHIPSRVACLHYEYYRNTDNLISDLVSHKNEIQCVVGPSMPGIDCIPFGEAQNPSLNTYADNIDTMSFLTSLPSYT